MILLLRIILLVLWELDFTSSKLTPNNPIVLYTYHDYQPFEFPPPPNCHHLLESSEIVTPLIIDLYYLDTVKLISTGIIIWNEKITRKWHPTKGHGFK